MVRVCFVCLGNICRSPTAEGVMRHLVNSAGLTGQIEVASAGTSAYHLGELPDRRSTQAARRRGFELTGRSQQFGPSDFDRFDYVVAMDRSNLRDLRALVANEEQANKLVLLRDCDPESPPGSNVPDPYFGGEEGFDHVLDVCEAGCRHLLQRIKREHGL
jgi:protein-tyrosine phosphatase